MNAHFSKIVLALFLTATLWAATGLAADRYWVGGDGTWNDTAHWSATAGGAGGASVPSSGDKVYLTNNVGDIVVSYINTANPALSNLLIEGISGASVTVTQSQDSLTVTGMVWIATSVCSKATFVQNGGTNIFAIGASPACSFRIADSETATGVYHLVDGFLASAGSDNNQKTVYIGYNGNGTFIQDGGRFQGNITNSITNTNGKKLSSAVGLLIRPAAGASIT